MITRLFTALLSALLLTGCWGLQDISELALVLAVGVDRNEEEGLVRVTVQIARPAPGGSGQGEGLSGSANPVRVASAEAPTIFEAIRVLAGSASRRLMWAHNQVILIGQAQAEHGILEVVDFFTRNPQLRYRTLIALVPGEAQPLLAESTGLESLPGIGIEKNFRYARLVGVARRVDIKEFAAAALSDDRSPVLPVIRLVPRLVPSNTSEKNQAEEAEITGMAVFRGGRLATVLDRSASRGLLLAEGELGRVVVSVPCPAGEGDPVSAELVASAARIEPVAKGGGGLEFRLAAELSLAITSVGCQVEYRDPKVLNRLERDFEELFAADFSRMLAEVRETGTDPGGFGRYVRVRLPYLWQRLSPRWPEAMEAVKVESRVTVAIVGSEVLYRPTIWRRGAGTGE